MGVLLTLAWETAGGRVRWLDGSAQLRHDRDPRVAAEALPCAQQLLVFAPELVNIRDLLPELQAFLATAPPFLRSGTRQRVRWPEGRV